MVNIAFERRKAKPLRQPRRIDLVLYPPIKAARYQLHATQCIMLSRQRRGGFGWEILTHFPARRRSPSPPRQKETEYISNTDYFGRSVFTYSLKQRINDGFLAPNKVIKVHIGSTSVARRAISPTPISKASRCRFTTRVRAIPSRRPDETPGGFGENEQSPYQPVCFEVTSLGDLHLGASGEIIRVDDHAAGKGWFVSAAPEDDAQFGQRMSTTRL